MHELYVPLVRQDGENDTCYTVRLNWDHDIFKGHFPGNHVLPGVCTVQIIAELLADILDEDISMESASNIKYLSFIAPSQGNNFSFSIMHSLKEDGRIACSAKVFNANAIFCTFKGEFVMTLTDLQ